MAGGMNPRGAALPPFIREASAARAAKRARAFAWVEGREAEPGPWPGIVVTWHRAEAGWLALAAYSITDAGGVSRLAVEYASADRLRPRGE
jgi:hypothetical protein